MTQTVLFLSKGINASSTRYRALQYFALLRQADFAPKHLTISGGMLPFIKALYQASQADVVVLIRKTFPYPLFWLLRKCCKKLIFDFDDAIFCNSDGSKSTTRMKRFAQTVQASDEIFAGNRYLAKTAERYQANTSVIPTSVDTKRYDLNTQKNQPNFTLVWIGSRSTQKYIAGILPSIEHAAEKIPYLTLKIIADFSLSSTAVQIENIAWSEATEAKAIYECDIGLAPLPADDWTKGKCALKVLQYMAAGLPVITSPTGANAEVIKHLNHGYYAKDAAEWSIMICQAYEEKFMLKTMGSAAKDRVAQGYDIAVIFNKMRARLQAV